MFKQSRKCKNLQVHILRDINTTYTYFMSLQFGIESNVISSHYLPYQSHRLQFYKSSSNRLSLSFTRLTRMRNEDLEANDDYPVSNVQLASVRFQYRGCKR